MAIYADQAPHSDAQACFLQNFPLTCLCRGLPWLHAPARQAPLTVVGAAREQDSSLWIHDRGGASQPDFALFADPFPVKNLSHFVIPSFNLGSRRWKRLIMATGRAA